MTQLQKKMTSKSALLTLIVATLNDWSGQSRRFIGRTVQVVAIVLMIFYPNIVLGQDDPCPPASMPILLSAPWDNGRTLRAGGTTGYWHGESAGHSGSAVCAVDFSLNPGEMGIHLTQVF